MSEGDPDDQRGSGVLRAMNALLHPEGRSAADDDPIVVLRAAAGGRQKPLIVRYQAGAFFVDGWLVRLDAWTSAPAQELSERLADLGIAALQLHPAVSAANLRAFAEAAVRALREGTALTSRVEGIAVERLPPDGQGAALLADYLALVQALKALGKLSAGADVLPLRRALQVITAEQRTDGAYQLLAAAGVLKRDRPHIAATRALDAMGFAAWNGLEPREIFEMGLSAALATLTPTADPTRSARLMLSLRGLGAAAEAAVVSVSDARAARRGKPAGAAGRLITLLERYSERLLSGEAPADALAALRGGQDPQVDAGLAALFARWKGPWPLGTPVALSDGAQGVVVGRPEGPPEVVTFDARGTAVEHLDLATAGVAAERSLALVGLAPQLTTLFRSEALVGVAEDLEANLDWSPDEEDVAAPGAPVKRRIVADDAWMAQPALSAGYDELEKFEPPTEEEDLSELTFD